MKIDYYHVDSFTSERFKGNPAGVCFLEDEITTELQQNIAFENNLSNIAFVRNTAGGYQLRWFTPTIEVSLCGHATLAAAHVLWNENLVSSTNPIIFHTLSGKLTVEKQSNGYIQMNFPVIPIRISQLPSALKQAIPFNIVNCAASTDRFLIELNSPQEVKNFQPDFSKLREYSFMITAKGADDSPYDFVSRFFAPNVGVPEDPVTGSAQCSLALYWAEKLNKKQFHAYQASKRGGELILSLVGDRVLISGNAVTFSKGVIYV